VTGPFSEIATSAPSSRERPHLSVEPVYGVDQLAPCRAAWERLFDAAPNEPSTSYEWTDALSRSHLSPGDRFILLKVRSGPDPIAFVPLVARSERLVGLPVVVLSPISEWYNTHSSILARERTREVADAVVDAMAGLGVRWDLFQMSRLLDEDPLLDHLRASLVQRGSSFEIRQIDPSYLLALPNSFDAFLAARSAKFRNHLKRTRRRINALPSATVIEWDQLADFDEAYEMLLTVEKNSWKQANGTAITAIERQTNFYRNMSRGAASAGRLHLHFLMIDGAPVAYNLGCVVGDRYSYLKTSFDETVRSLGASTYLRAHLVESLIAHKLRWLDFPAEPYEWERQWTETVRWHRSIVIYNSTWSARLLSGINRVRRRQAAKPQFAHGDTRKPVPAGD
jgi:CelD/BcsL family acetyltransferase involved in cellulose biosynthesis